MNEHVTIDVQDIWYPKLRVVREEACTLRGALAAWNRLLIALGCPDGWEARDDRYREVVAEYYQQESDRTWREAVVEANRIADELGL
jgi:hypothetical protein